MSAEGGATGPEGGAAPHPGSIGRVDRPDQPPAAPEPAPAHEPWPGPVGVPAPRRDPRPGWSDELVAASLVMVVLAVCGVLWGYLWHLLAPGPMIEMTASGPVHADATSETYFANDGWFAALGAVVGLSAAIGVWFLAYRHRGPLVMIGTVAGCLIGGFVAWQVGRHIGLPEFEQLIAHAPEGESFRRPTKLVAYGLLAVPGFTAAFTYTLLAGWSRWPGLRRPAAGEWPVPATPWQTAPPA